MSVIVPRLSDVPSVKGVVQQTAPGAVLVDEEYVGGPAKTAAAPAATANKKAAAATDPKKDAAAIVVDAGQTARLVYSLKTIQEVKTIVRALEQDQQYHAKNGTTSMVSGWGMSQTSLEDVFLQMIK